jgi:hypothetical protein
MHPLYDLAVQQARQVQMTAGERETQLISRVYGNVHLEFPELTREMVRKLVTEHREAAQRNGNAVGR